MTYINPNKLVAYTKSLKTLFTYIVYNPDGSYQATEGTITELQLLERLNLILEDFLFYLKPKIIFQMEDLKERIAYFNTDEQMNTFEQVKLTPLNFINIESEISAKN